MSRSKFIVTQDGAREFHTRDGILFRSKETRDDQCRVKSDSSTGTGPTSTVRCVFSMKLVVPVDDVQPRTRPLQMQRRMRSIVSRRLNACPRDRYRRRNSFSLYNFLHVLVYIDKLHC